MTLKLNSQEKDAFFSAAEAQSLAKRTWFN